MANWLGLERLTSEHYFSQESGRQSLMRYGGMWRVALYPFLCVSLGFLTPLLFKQASEHLNDQNSAAWLSAPMLSNLDGYVSASERGRHGRYTYTTQSRTYAHTRPHVQCRFCRQANACRHTRQLSRAEKWKNVLLSGNAVNHTTVQKQQLSVQLETRGQKARIFLLNFQSFVKHKSVANSFLAFTVL